MLATGFSKIFLIVIVFQIYCGYCIYNGEEAGESFILTGKRRYRNPGEFAYLAALENDGKLVCGAVIIKDDAVLTAANCVRGVRKDKITIRAGTIVKYDKSEVVQLRNVKHIYHENDTAILVLDKKFKFGGFTRKINMATEEERNNAFNKEVLIAGWGRTEKGVRPEVLMKASVTLIRNKECQDILEQGKTLGFLEKYKTIDTSMICTKSKRKIFPAIGDAGGPVVFRVGRKHILIGISSFFFYENKGVNYPSTYVDIVNVKPWVQEQLESSNECLGCFG